MAQIQVVRFSSRPARAWANGGGSTRVLVDDADDRGEWSYRVSVADLSGRQSFSRFEGVDRHLTFLGPGSLQLEVNGVEHTLERSDAIRFAGEDAVSSAPSAPSALDLNVLVRRGLRLLRATPTVGVTGVAPPTGATAMWIPLEPGGRADEQELDRLDVVIVQAGAHVEVEGHGTLIELLASPDHDGNSTRPAIHGRAQA